MPEEGKKVKKPGIGRKRRALKAKLSPYRLAPVAGPRLGAKRCAAKARSGERCKSAPVRGKKRCLFHLGDNASVFGARGGRRRAIFNPDGLEPFTAPKNAGDLLLLLAQTIVEVRSGRLEPRVANSLSYVAGAFMSALETSDLDVRLRALEGRHSTLEKQRSQSVQ
jgi:hypothetical protein